MAEQTPASYGGPTLSGMLSELRARHELPEERISPEDLLIGTARRDLTALAMESAAENNKAAGARLRHAEQMFQKAAGEGTLWAALGRPPPDGDSQDAGRQFRRAYIAYDAALAKKAGTEREVELADAIRTRRKELRRIPQLAMVALSTLLIGGAGAYHIHTIQEHAQQQLAVVRTVPTTDTQLRTLVLQASTPYTVTGDTVLTLSGAGIGGLAAYGLRNEIPRQRARRRVLRAKRQVAAAGEPPAQ